MVTRRSALSHILTSASLLLPGTNPGDLVELMIL